MTIQTFERVQNHIQAILFDGTRESGLEISKWVGSGSRFIPASKEDPRPVVQIVTIVGRRDIKEGEWAVKIGPGEFVHYKPEAFLSEYLLVMDGESNLVKHARAELSRFPDEEIEFIESIMATIKGFASYRGHSGGSAAMARHIVHTLLGLENLMPLTTDPAEWELRSKEQYKTDTDLWQNNRNSKAISKDGGKTYFLVDGPMADEDNLVYYTAEEPNAPGPEIDPEDLKSDDEKTEEK